MNYQEEELWNRAREYVSAQVEIGTVGWDGVDQWYEKGSGTNDGFTIVRVQLHRGKDPATERKQGIAQGMQILCMIPDGMFRIPKKGTRCYVLLPAGYEQVPGAGVIVCCVSPNPTVQFEDDRVVVDYGADVHVVIKGKSVSLSDPSNRFLTVGTPRSGGAAGLTFQAEDGSGGVVQAGVVSWFVASGGDAKTILQMTTTKAEMMLKGSSNAMWQLTTNGFYTVGTTATLAAAAVYLGKVPTAATPVLYGSPGTPLASTAVFVSPS